MKKYEEEIAEYSTWVTSTPSETVRALPFYALEAGHFFANSEYVTERDYHDSLLIIYTLNGAGSVTSGSASISLEARQAVVIDCRSPHRYAAACDSWDFLWMHLDGISASAMLGILYPKLPRAITTSDTSVIERLFEDIMNRMVNQSLADGAEVSARIHELFNILIRSSVSDEADRLRMRYSADIERVLDFIRNHYSEPITVDDMISGIPISKFHFIRVFRRIMGVTPYSYLTDFRINTSKTLLCSTDKSVSEIAALCGFADTCNFISHFKTRVGQKPAQYRRDFG